MMNLQDYPSVPPEWIPALEAALLRYEEATARMADFKKEYASVKAKVRRLEKHMAAMDEATHSHWIMSMAHDVQLAVNKFALIDKKVERFMNERERYCKSSLKALRSSEPMEPNLPRWHIEQINFYYTGTNDLLHDVLDMLRIAKGHLAKVDSAKKSIVKYLGRQALFGQR